MSVTIAMLEANSSDISEQILRTDWSDVWIDTPVGVVQQVWCSKGGTLDAGLIKD